MSGHGAELDKPQAQDKFPDDVLSIENKGENLENTFWWVSNIITIAGQSFSTRT